jgi:uncharacterized protein YndB with AHSA1/START domain
MAETKRSLVEDTSDREIVLTRVFDAPRDLVWKAITIPAHLVQWWGPIGFTTTVEEMDVRPGGVWKHIMHGPDGTDYPGKSVFTEVVIPERLSFTHSGGKKGGPAAQFDSTWTFEAQGEKTKVTLRMVFPTAALRDLNENTYHAIEGGQQTLSRLAWHLPKMSSVTARPPRELHLTRVLDAPRVQVFKMWTDANHLSQWWGPRGFTNSACEIDVRPGGAIRIDMRGPDGTVYPMTGEFREIVAPERLVFTSAAIDAKGEALFENLNTITFSEQAGKTTLTVAVQVLRMKPEAAPYLAGMEIGWSQSLERLAEHLK